MPEAGRVWITRPAFVRQSLANVWQPLRALRWRSASASSPSHGALLAHVIPTTKRPWPRRTSVTPPIKPARSRIPFRRWRASRRICMASSSCASTAKCSRQAMRARRWCRLKSQRHSPRRSSAEQRGADVFSSSTAGALAGTAPVPPGRNPADWGKPSTTALAPEGALAALSLVQPQANAEGKWRALLDNLNGFSGRSARHSTSVSTSPRRLRQSASMRRRAIFPRMAGLPMTRRPPRTFI